VAALSRDLQGGFVVGDKKCFVVMGFGRKTDYQSGRVLDLDKSYQYIIKPAAEEAGLDCKRADEIIHSGLIDVPMYEQLLAADVVIADISTSNANAFYELGVRHALRPYTTITIAEDKMMFPFDVSHLAVRKYHHLGEGIDFGEVVRMKGELINALRSILETPQKDSPVYTFFADLEPPVRKKIEQAVAQSAPGAAPVTGTQPGSHAVIDPTMSILMEQANAAIEKDEFVSACALLSSVRRMAPKDPYVIQRLVLATYKSKMPDPMQALLNAQTILRELKPADSTDTETLGLWGAIHKRIWELTEARENLEIAIFAYEKGFYVKNDYYNGINLAYLYDLRASISALADATADFVLAERIRRRVLTICDQLLSEGTGLHLEERYWVVATMAEAWTGLGEDSKADESLLQAKALSPPAWMVETTERQLVALKKLLKDRTP
jgi:tetratricopeptide (TPR) repeat protein